MTRCTSKKHLFPAGRKGVVFSFGASSSAWVRFLFVTALLLRPATTAHVGPDALVRAGEPCSPTSCDAPHRWAGEGTRPYVTCPDDPLASATTTDILLQF